MNIIKLLLLFTLATLMFACKGAPAPDDSTSEEETQEEQTTEEENGENQEEQTEEEEEIDLGSGECPYSGNIRYTLNNPNSWPADVRQLITDAMDDAIWYYNCYADLSHNITVNYNPGVPTAEANEDGWMSFGSNKSYMVVATAMHEVGHTMGVGYYPWTELTDGNKRWQGEEVKKVIEAIPPEQRDPGAANYITADGTHFWPYGLNYASEHHNEWSLINHVKIVAAMQVDKNTFLGR